MKIRWPFVLRSTYDGEARLHVLQESVTRQYRDAMCRGNERIAELQSVLAETNEGVDIQSDEIRDCHEHIATLDAEIARLRSAPVQAVAPFWLGLPNEILSLIVTTNMDGVQATIGGLGHDEESDDPRCNPTLPFALKPL